MLKIYLGKVDSLDGGSVMVFDAGTTNAKAFTHNSATDEWSLGSDSGSDFSLCQFYGSKVLFHSNDIDS